MTATCHQLGYDNYIATVEREGERFLEVLATADIAADVPTCPGWSVATLTDHLGGVHRWAAEHVATGSQERVSGRDVPNNAPESDDVRADWFAAGIRRMKEVFPDGDPDAPVWAWGSDKHVRFWPRRMTHETTVHRADLELAAGIEPQIDPAVAVDGVDEFLDNLPHAAYFAPKVKELNGTGERLRFVATDAGVAWTIALFKDGFEWHHGGDEPNARVQGPAADLLLFLYGRKDPGGELSTSGHAGILERWRNNSSI